MPRPCSAVALALAVAVLAVVPDAPLAQQLPPRGFGFHLGQDGFGFGGGGGLGLPGLPLPQRAGLYGGGGSHRSHQSSFGGQSPFPEGGLHQFAGIGGAPSSSRFDYNLGGLPLFSGPHGGSGQSAYPKYGYSSGGQDHLPGLGGKHPNYEYTSEGQLPSPGFGGQSSYDLTSGGQHQLPSFGGQSSKYDKEYTGALPPVPSFGGDSQFGYSGEQQFPGIFGQSSYSKQHEIPELVGQWPAGFEVQRRPHTGGVQLQIPGFGGQSWPGQYEHAPGFGAPSPFGSLGLENLLRHLFPQLDLNKLTPPVKILESMFPHLDAKQLQQTLGAIFKAHPGLDAQAMLNPLQFFSEIVGRKDMISPFNFLDKLKDMFNTNSLNELFPQLDLQTTLAPIIVAWKKALLMPLQILSQFVPQLGSSWGDDSTDVLKQISRQLQSIQHAMPVTPQHFLAMAEPFLKQFLHFMPQAGVPSVPINPQQLLSLLEPLVPRGSDFGGHAGAAHQGHQFGGHRGQGALAAHLDHLGLGETSGLGGQAGQKQVESEKLGGSEPASESQAGFGAGQKPGLGIQGHGGLGLEGQGLGGQGHKGKQEGLGGVGGLLGHGGYGGQFGSEAQGGLGGSTLGAHGGLEGQAGRGQGPEAGGQGVFNAGLGGQGQKGKQEGLGGVGGLLGHQGGYGGQFGSEAQGGLGGSTLGAHGGLEGQAGRGQGPEAGGQGVFNAGQRGSGSSGFGWQGGLTGQGASHGEGQEDAHLGVGLGDSAQGHGGMAGSAGLGLRPATGGLGGSLNFGRGRGLPSVSQ